MITPASLTVLTIGASTRAAITSHALAATDGLETGGVLLGHHRPGRLDITDSAGPGPGAARSATTFLRDLDHARRAAADAYNDHRAVWIGEWHTHPSGPTTPSTLDVDTYRRLLADPELAFLVFASLIVRPTPDFVPATHRGIEVTAWMCDLHAVISTPLHTI